MKANFSLQSALYVKYRPSYPPEMIDYIVSLVKEKDMAWDCGTGNGQTAKGLSSYFNKVFATDVSQKQLDNAYQAANIFYSVQPAEQTIFLSNSFDLITVSQALHWFRFDEFYAEVNRIAKPEAILAAWTYSLLRISKEIDTLIDDLHYNILSNYWDKERRYVDEYYRTIPFPLKKIESPVFNIDYRWKIDELEGYLTTWSGLQNFIAAGNNNPLPELMKRIKSHWKDPMPIVFPLHLLIGKVEK